MEQHYSFEGYEKTNMARACGRDLPISMKHAMEICSMLKNKRLSDAKKILERVVQFKQAVPFKRFTNGYGHKPGMCAGAYPIKASTMILELLNSVESNAQQKGLHTGDLSIIHFRAQKGSRTMHPSRFRGRRMKATHVEVVVREVAASEKKTEGKIGKSEGKKETKTTVAPKVQRLQPAINAPQPTTHSSQSHTPQPKRGPQ